MLSCFDLTDEITVNAFQTSLARFSAYMHEHELIESVGKLGRRRSDTPMDTDESRSLGYYFIMSFDDREQCDAAYAFINNESQSHDAHTAVISKVRDAVFICWEDVDP